MPSAVGPDLLLANAMFCWAPGRIASAARTFFRGLR